MIPTIAIVSQKGGVGKTTTAMGISLALANKGHSILLVDADPQGGAVHSLKSPAGSQSRKGLYHVLAGEVELGETITGTFVDNLAVVDSGLEHTSRNTQQFEEAFRAHGLFKEALLTTAGDFELVLIDCPPGLGTVTEAVLKTVTHVLIPLQCEPLSLRTLSQLIQQLLEIRTSDNPDLRLLGILLTMFDADNAMSMSVRDQVFQHFENDFVFRQVIPRDPHLNFLFAGHDDVKELLMDLHQSSDGLKAYRSIADHLQSLLIASPALA